MTDNTPMRGELAAALLSHDDLLLSRNPGDDSTAGWHETESPVLLVGQESAASAVAGTAPERLVDTTRAILIVDQLCDEIADQALRDGFLGIVETDEIWGRLPSAIREVAQGGVAFPDHVTRRCIVDRRGMWLRPRDSAQ